MAFLADMVIILVSWPRLFSPRHNLFYQKQTCASTKGCVCVWWGGVGGSEFSLNLTKRVPIRSATVLLVPDIIISSVQFIGI